LRSLTEGPEPKVVRVGIRTKGCSGQQYDLQYTTKKERFDEEVKQDGMFFFFASFERTRILLFPRAGFFIFPHTDVRFSSGFLL
jgi:Fe-S cluster assembly iron-binding protein IscA